MERSQKMIIEPASVLEFKGPFNTVVTADIRLSNPTDTPLAFKVKTTAPKQYCVRPNSGVVPVSGARDIQVMLQPIDVAKLDPATLGKHKFLVQTCIVGDDHADKPIDELWKTINVKNMMDTKLRVTFDPPLKGSKTERDDKRVSEATSVVSNMTAYTSVDTRSAIDVTEESAPAENDVTYKELMRANATIAKLKDQIEGLKRMAINEDDGCDDGVSVGCVLLRSGLPLVLGIVLGVLITYALLVLA